MLDGQDINDVGLGGQAFQPQIPDMFQEVTALTNSASAEYGRAGGAVVNLISKAGTNQFHGTAFELYSGSGLNAVDGVTRVGSTSRANKARYDQHQYGFTAGGPILKNKLFAFGGTQFTRYYGNATSGQIELPDANGYATLTSIGGPQVALLQTLLSNGSYLTRYQYKASLGVVEEINVGQPASGTEPLARPADVSSQRVFISGPRYRSNRPTPNGSTGLITFRTRKIRSLFVTCTTATTSSPIWASTLRVFPDLMGRSAALRSLPQETGPTSFRQNC